MNWNDGISEHTIKMRFEQTLDGRTRLVCLIALSIAHTLAHGWFVAVLLSVTGVVILLFPGSFKRGLRVILLTAAVIASISTVVFLSGNAQSEESLFWDFLRWVSLVTLTVTLALSMNVFDFVTSLHYLKLPVKVALAFGVGLRFLPSIADELQRITSVQRQANFGFSTNNIRRFGVYGVLERKVAPLFSAVFRRIDSLVISVGAQELEYRIAIHNYPKFKASDAIAATLAAVMCGLAIAIR